MIEYVEIRNTGRDVVGIIDTAQSIIWHTVYYGVGDFEIYAMATPEHIRILKQGYYVTRPNEIDVGIIENVEIGYNDIDGFMITAKGRFAKSILDRRLIYRLSGKTNKATILTGNVESAARALVANNAISCTWDTKRNIPQLVLGAHSGSTAIIVDENGNAAQKQVSHENLLEYSDGLLKEYEMSAMVILNDETYKLEYVCFAGADRSMDNTAGNDPVIFSEEYDNLSASNFSADNKFEKNVALVGGQGEGINRFYAIVAGNEYSLDRRELWVDASGISRTYQDDSEEQHEYTAAEYREMLKTEGKQELAEYKATESFTGTLNVTFGSWQFNRDFWLGDIVTVQDNKIGKYASVRITEVTEIQDENGYTVDAIFE